MGKKNKNTEPDVDIETDTEPDVDIEPVVGPRKMLLIARERCFIGNTVRNRGERFSYIGECAPVCCDVVEVYDGAATPVVEEPYANLTDDQIRSRLEAYFIKVPSLISREDMVTMLLTAEGKN